MNQIAAPMDLEEFNRRAADCIKAIKDKSWMINQASMKMKAGTKLHRHQQQAVYNFVHKNRAQIEDAEVLAFAAARERMERHWVGRRIPKA